MENYELLVNPDSRRWRDVLAMGEEELGWKASQHDYDSYIKGYGKDGKFKGLFLVDTDSRETIGSALCAVVDVGKNDKLMSIGWYYMKKELRGKGIGTELFNKLIEEEKRKKTNMCLTSAVDMSVKYAAKYGFAEYSWHISVISVAACDIDVFNFEVDNTIKVYDIAQVAWDRIVAFDKLVQGDVHRSNFLKSFFAQKGAKNKIAVDAEENVIGFCNVRTVGMDEKDVIIAPFYARDKNVASAVLKETLMAAGDTLTSCRSILLCPPKHNQEALEIMQTLSNDKATILTSYPRQFTQSVIPAKEQMIFSITDYVLGHA